MRICLGVLLLSVFCISSQAQTVLGVWSGAPNSQSGTDVVNVGDADGDGFPDFAFGAPGLGSAMAPQPGSVTVISARANTISTINAPFPSFGTQVVALGDQDLPPDGVPEIAIGAPAADALGTQPNSGVLFVFDTNGAQRGAVVSLVGGEQVGSVIANVGDLDGDGLAELALRRGPAPSQVEIYTVVNGVPLLLNVIPAPPVNFGAFGTSISRGGDYNTDFVPETVITDGRSAFVYDGATQALVATLAPGSPLISAGYTFAADIGDVNNDLINDLALGDTTLDQVDVISGNSIPPALPVITLYSSISPPAPTPGGYRYGNDIVSSGIDVTGDMAPEFLIGSPGWPFTPGLQSSGFVGVVSGGNGAALGAYLDPNPAPSPIGYGTSLDVVDVNLDGLPEILVGAPGGFANPSGQVSVISPIPYIGTATPAGASCNVAGGAAGTTIAIATGSGPPRLGATISVSISGAPAGTAGTLFVGAPLPPTPIGPCTKYLDETAPLTIPYGFVTDATGSATVPITVPGDMTIVLQPVNAQAAVGTEVSNALLMRIGG